MRTMFFTASEGGLYDNYTQYCMKIIHFSSKNLKIVNYEW